MALTVAGQQAPRLTRTISQRGFHAPIEVTEPLSRPPKASLSEQWPLFKRLLSCTIFSQDLKAHGGDLDDVIRSILAADKWLEQQKLRPRREPDPERLAIAEQRIAELRRERRRRQLESLPAHQVDFKRWDRDFHRDMDAWINILRQAR